MPFRNTNYNGYSWMIIYGAYHLRSPLANDYETQSGRNSSCFFTWGKTYLQNIIRYYEKLTSFSYLSRGLNGEDISFCSRDIEIILSRVFRFACSKQTLFTGEICGDFLVIIEYSIYWWLTIELRETEIFSWFLNRLFIW